MAHAPIHPKKIKSLTAGDFADVFIWEYVRGGDDLVSPVGRGPVENLTGRVVASAVTLANGTKVPALLGNIDVHNKKITKHFLTISILVGTQWFVLSRYHDFDYTTNGPPALASLLGLPVNEIFPITYDISGVVAGGDPSVLRGEVEADPEEKLSKEEVIALAIS